MANRASCIYHYGNHFHFPSYFGKNTFLHDKSTTVCEQSSQTGRPLRESTRAALASTTTSATEVIHSTKQIDWEYFF